MSAYKIRTPGNYPEESTQHSEHGQSLKSRISGLFDHWRTQQGEPHPGSPPRSKISKKQILWARCYQRFYAIYA
jgi:hypothetical protein